MAKDAGHLVVRFLALLPRAIRHLQYAQSRVAKTSWRWLLPGQFPERSETDARGCSLPWVRYRLGCCRHSHGTGQTLQAHGGPLANAGSMTSCYQLRQ